MKVNYWYALLFLSFTSFGQRVKIPASHSNIKYVGQSMVVEIDGKQVPQIIYANPLELENIRGKIAGTKTGLYFDFNDAELSGKLVFGLIPFEDSKHPQPVYFARSATITGGRVAINIVNQLRGTYDMVGWEANKKGTIGYRVINSAGSILYDGHISFSGTGPFKVDDTIIEGPFINLLKADGVTISFTTNTEIIGKVKLADQSFSDAVATKNHEINLTGLKPNTVYDYTVTYGANSVSYSFKTAPSPGSRSKFTFAYASDSRSGSGGGERNIHGTNAYIVKKIMALT